MNGLNPWRSRGGIGSQLPTELLQPCNEERVKRCPAVHWSSQQKLLRLSVVSGNLCFSDVVRSDSRLAAVTLMKLPVPPQSSPLPPV